MLTFDEVMAALDDANKTDDEKFSIARQYMEEAALRQQNIEDTYQEKLDAARAYLRQAQREELEHQLAFSRKLEELNIDLAAPPSTNQNGTS